MTRTPRDEEHAREDDDSGDGDAHVDESDRLEPVLHLDAESMRAAQGIAEHFDAIRADLEPQMRDILEAQLASEQMARAYRSQLAEILGSLQPAFEAVRAQGDDLHLAVTRALTGVAQVSYATVMEAQVVAEAALDDLDEHDDDTSGEWPEQLRLVATNTSALLAQARASADAQKRRDLVFVVVMLLVWLVPPDQASETAGRAVQALREWLALAAAWLDS